MRVRIEKDYNNFKQGDVVDVNDRTARNLFKLKVASVDRMMTKSDVEFTTKEVPSTPKKSFIKRVFKR